MSDQEDKKASMEDEKSAEKDLKEESSEKSKVKGQKKEEEPKKEGGDAEMPEDKPEEKEVNAENKPSENTEEKEKESEEKDSGGKTESKTADKAEEEKEAGKTPAKEGKKEKKPVEKPGEEAGKKSESEDDEEDDDDETGISKGDGEEDVDAVEDEKKIKKASKPRRQREKPEVDIASTWEPKTRLGQMVKNKEITSMHDALRRTAPIMEVEIVDLLLPDLEEAILDVGRVQRTTDSGRRMRFRVVAAVGNRNGYVGIGVSKGKDAGPTIRMALKKAKLNIIEVKRGCGSWECGCGAPHTVPFKTSGKSGSVKVELKPAPKGVGLVSGEIAKQITGLSGMTDVWVKTHGHTRTPINFSKAVFEALKNTNRVKANDEVKEALNVVVGSKKADEAVPEKGGLDE